LEVSDFNPCLQKIFKGQAPSEVCELEKLDFSYEESTQIDNHAWAYSDPTPGIVLETCGEKRNKTSLSTEGILNINPNCTYTITNGPFVQAQMPSPGDSLGDVVQAMSFLNKIAGAPPVYRRW
jgi:hypothetical protein